MSILPPIGAEGEARRDAALNLLRVRRADLIRERTADAHARPLSDWRLADASAATVRLAALRTDH